MAVHWQIPFKSLRSGTIYTVNIYESSYGGSAVVLNGGAQPFTTKEDGNEDMFTPIRTQSGYFRIVDVGGGFNWKELLPSTDSDRAVTLTANGTVVWQGFMQSQTFSGVLYGNPQEREFPVTCALSILSGEDINFNRGLKNFAFLLKEVCDTIATMSGNVIGIDTLMIQGGSDARKWLQKQVDWKNFSAEDNAGILRAKYSLFEVLEDMCRFWGWTARTSGKTLYLTCADDSSEQAYLQLTYAQLNTLSSATNDTSTGTIISTPPTVILADSQATHIFASTDQSDYKIQGPHRAVVQADCNEHDTIIQFAPQDVREWLGEDYHWVQGDGDLVGYFTTPMKRGTQEFSTLCLYASSTGGFCRRQIYQSAESDSATVSDMICVLTGHSVTIPSVQIQTMQPMAYGGGSLSLSGQVFRGTEQMNNDLYSIQMRLGIGMTRGTAKWWYMNQVLSPSQQTISRGWAIGTPSIFSVPINGGSLKTTGFYSAIFHTLPYALVAYPSIPIPSDTYGYIFLDILGFTDGTNGNEVENYEISNLSIKFSRDSYDIPESIGVVRPRTLEVERITTKEYSAVNTNDSKEEWNANCIFATDSNMEYGYGLIIDGNGNVVSTVDYGQTTDHPEQHLANRVASYWQSAKRKIDAELMSHVTQSISTGGTIAIGSIVPHHKITMDGNTFAPIAISRDWRDDIVKLSLLQL